ncbi:MAG: sugar-binding domain-containing protein [Muribaculaceae bacterium]
MKKISIMILLLLALLPATVKSQPGCSVLPLDGIWSFKSDPLGMGLQSNGLQMFPSMSETITLPGTTDEAAKGMRTQGLSSIRLTRTFEYKGPAWYEKKVFIPEDWEEKEVTLFLERAHIESKLWVNGSYVGLNESLSVPHEFVIGKYLRPGQLNTIRLRITNDLYNFEYTHALSAETQTNWNGVIGKIELRATDKVYISDVQVYPDLKQKNAHLIVTVSNSKKEQLNGKLTIDGRVIDCQYNIPTTSIEVTGSDSLMVLNFDLPLGSKIFTWDEYAPNLYNINLSLDVEAAGKRYSDVRNLDFGMREVTVNGKHFAINGRDIFIRGTVNSAEFPLTGHPVMDEEGWMHILGTCKEYGLNCMRFHSWCPPEAAFRVADRLGLYLQVENSDWRFTVGVNKAVDDYLTRDADRILRTYGNHPSFVFFCEGNELCGKGVTDYLSKAVARWRADKRHLYTGSAAYPYVPENQYNVLYGARPHRWKEGLKSRFNVSPLNTLYDYSEYVEKYPIPMITHEIGQWCVYPNYDEIKKYTGVLKPYNYEIFRESLRDHHMLDMAPMFTLASGKFHLIQKKEEFESYYRTPNMAGYHLLQLNDFPGQGTSPVGVVDAFWDPKPYVTADEFKQLVSPCMPLLLTSSFVWTNDSVFTGKVSVANFTQSALRKAVLKWTLRRSNGTVYAQGKLPAKDIAIGSPHSVGSISIPLNRVKDADQMKLDIEIAGTPYKNNWSIWVYPSRLPQVDVPSEVRIAYKWDDELKAYLKRGGKAVLLADTADVKATVSSCFSGISWNAVWSGMPPELLGILCNPEHPIYAYFPTEFHSNWQWWDLVIPSKLMNLDHTPSTFRPLLQMIPDWNKNNKLGLVVEAKVGEGELLICTIDLVNNMERRPVARQFRYSLEKYVSSPDFNPSQKLAEKDIDLMFK